MAIIAGIDTEGVDAEEFARAVRETPDAELGALFDGPDRTTILDAIFGRFAAHLRRDRARDGKIVIHWKVYDRPGGGYDHYELVVDEGACTVHNPPRTEPTVTLKLKPLAFLKLVTGNAEGPMLFLRGKLKIDGDLMTAARLTDLFAIPRAG